MASGETYRAGQWGSQGRENTVSWSSKVPCNPDSVSSAYHRVDCHRDNRNGHQGAPPGVLRPQAL